MRDRILVHHCQKPHHTLLHAEAKEESPSPVQSPPSTTTPIPTHAAMGIKSNLLLMTYCVLVKAPDGSYVEAQALLDSASSASFGTRQIKALIEFLHWQETNETIPISAHVRILTRSSSLKEPHILVAVGGCCKKLRVASNVKLIFEELATVLIQIEACLNS